MNLEHRSARFSLLVLASLVLGVIPRPVAVAMLVPTSSLGGTMNGLEADKVTCRNKTAGTKTTDPRADDPTWDCEALGLVVSSGDRVQTTASGTVIDVSVGATIRGMTPTSATCENATRGTKVSIRTSSPNVDCTAMGLFMVGNDHVNVTASGIAD